MEKKAGKKKSADDLRKRAEKQLKSKTEITEEILGTNTPELIHELEVHQIELEMQNEELRRAHIELTESRNRYYDLYDLAPVGYFSLDLKGRILEVNLSGAHLLGIERSALIKKKFTQVTTPEFQDTFYLFQKQVFETRTRQSRELLLKSKNAAPFWAYLEGIVSQDAEGGSPQMRVVVIDINERKQAQKLLEKQTHDIEDRVKELDCLYGISKLVENKNISLEGIFRGIVELVTLSWQDPAITCARIIYKDQVYQTDNYKETPWKQAQDIVLYGARIGALEINYLVKKPECDEGPFLKEERNLINAIAQRLGRIIERKQIQEALKESHDLLEKKVAERTMELSTANEQLTSEIAKRKKSERQVRLNQSRLKALLQLSEMREMTIEQISAFVLEKQIKLTQSRIGFIAFTNHEQDAMIPCVWSKEVMKECSVTDKSIHFPIEKGGLWVKAFREKKPFIENNYAAPNSYKKGYPEGHVILTRIMVVPILTDGRIVALAAVANKRENYNQLDLRQLKLLIEAMWEIIVGKQAEEELKQSEKQLRSLSSALLTAQEKERKRVAEELHDSVGQTLSALKFSIENILNHSSGKLNAKSIQSMNALISKVQGAVREVNRIGRGLRPSMLDDLGITSSLLWFCREFQTVYPKIQIKQEIDIAEDEVPENYKVVIYRVLQESLHNIAKHSGADIILISLKKTDNSIEFSVTDNGEGFDIENALLQEEEGGLGLPSIIKRIELSGGVCKITSGKEMGATIQAVWPS